MKLVFLCSGSMAVWCLIYGTLSSINRKSLQMSRRLEEIQKNIIIEDQEKSVRQQKKLKLDFLRISQGMKNDIQLSGIKMSPEEFILLWILVVLGPAMLNYSFTQTFLRSVILILAGVMIPPLVIKSLIQKQRVMFERQLSDALIVLSNGLKAGFSFNQAIANVAADLPAPIGNEFMSITRELHLGMDIEEAFLKVVDRMQSNDLKLLTSAVVIQRQVGGNLSEILDTIAKTIRDRLAIKRMVKTLTAQGSISGKVIGALPIAVFLLVSITSPGYMDPMFQTTLGWMMIAGCLLMEGMGFFIIHKIIDIKF